ncbi:MAG: DUF6352 family protein [Caldimonas sp.]
MRTDPHAADPSPEAASRWLVADDGFFRRLLDLPQLALVAESCRAERALHEALFEAPLRPVHAAELSALADADARDNYAVFLRFRDAVAASGTLEAYYLALMRSGNVDVPALFVDRVVEAIVAAMLADSTDAFEHRAGELLHRAQRVTVSDGQVLCGDLETLDHLHETAGFGDLGRLLREAQAPLRGSSLRVLGADAPLSHVQGDGARSFLLDLTHEVSNDLGHGLSFTMTRSHSGLRALARVLERWVHRFFDVATTITPMPKIDDAAWSWHIGLDIDSTALLNDLWRGEPAEPDRMQRLVGLFRLTFTSSDEMRPDLAGKPVYLGLAMSTTHTMKLKPQNLLLDLPLAPPM